MYKEHLESLTLLQELGYYKSLAEYLRSHDGGMVGLCIHYEQEASTKAISYQS